MARIVAVGLLVLGLAVTGCSKKNENDGKGPCGNAVKIGLSKTKTACVNKLEQETGLNPKFGACKKACLEESTSKKKYYKCLTPCVKFKK